MNQPKRNIAIFSSNWLGVSETFIYRQLEAIEDSEHSSIILTQKLKDSALKGYYNGKVYHKPLDRISFYKGIIDRKLNLHKNGYSCSYLQSKYWQSAINENDIDLIHAHYGPSGLHILPVAKKAKIPLITTFHGNDASAMLGKKSYVKALKELFKYSYIITVSDFLRERLIRLGAKEDRIVTHYIGTDLQRFEFVAHESVSTIVERKGRLRFLQVSNFVEKKGHKYTVLAFDNFLKHYPNAELIFGGDGPMLEEIKELVKSLGLVSNVNFLGAIPPKRVSNLMAKCDVFLHHSITGENGAEEGIPTVLMEAMASGIPVVSTIHAGITELIPDDCGYLVEEKNLEQYSKMLISLLGNETEVKARRAYEYIGENFDVKTQNKKLIDIYENVINGNN